MLVEYLFVCGMRFIDTHRHYSLHTCAGPINYILKLESNKISRIFGRNVWLRSQLKNFSIQLLFLWAAIFFPRVKLPFLKTNAAALPFFKTT